MESGKEWMRCEIKPMTGNRVRKKWLEDSIENWEGRERGLPRVFFGIGTSSFKVLSRLIWSAEKWDKLFSRVTAEYRDFLPPPPSESDFFPRQLLRISQTLIGTGRGRRKFFSRQICIGVTFFPLSDWFSKQQGIFAKPSLLFLTRKLLYSLRYLTCHGSRSQIRPFLCPRAHDTY